jgi:MFS superfamily sulfate permease-like transporter
MVVVAVLGLIRPAELVRFWRLSRTEFWVAVVTAGVGLWFGLLPAVLVGVLLTLFLVIRELDRVGLTELQLTPDGEDLLVAGAHTVPTPGLLVLRFDGPLYTANVRGANRRMLAAVDAARPRVLVLDTSALGMLPVTVLDEVQELLRELSARDTEVWFAAMPPRALATARQAPHWAEYEAAGRLYPSTLAAVRTYRSR